MPILHSAARRPNRGTLRPSVASGAVRRRQRLGGLLNYYVRVRLASFFTSVVESVPAKNSISRRPEADRRYGYVCGSVDGVTRVLVSTWPASAEVRAS